MLKSTQRSDGRWMAEQALERRWLRRLEAHLGFETLSLRSYLRGFWDCGELQEGAPVITCEEAQSDNPQAAA